MNLIKAFIYQLIWISHDKSAVYKPRSKVPAHEIMKIVRMYHPIITEFFENEEEMAKFQKWREEQKALENKKKKAESVA